MTGKVKEAVEKAAAKAYTVKSDEIPILMNRAPQLAEIALDLYEGGISVVECRDAEDWAGYFLASLVEESMVEGVDNIGRILDQGRFFSRLEAALVYFFDLGLVPAVVWGGWPREKKIRRLEKRMKKIKTLGSFLEKAGAKPMNLLEICAIGKRSRHKNMFTLEESGRLQTAARMIWGAEE